MAVDDQTLLTQAAAGDKDALSEVLDRFGPQVEHQLESKIGQQWRGALDAEDIMQVTFLEVFLQIDRLESSGPSGFVAWLTRIADNNLYDAIRALQADKRPQPNKRVQMPSRDESCVALIEALGGTLTTPSRQFARREAADLVQSAINRLPDDYQQVIRLYDLEGRSGPQVAEAMGKSRGAVHMLRARARDHLRDELGPASVFFSHSS
ncbi:MAG: RNA polymerase sigma factor [Planctomycetota bacterium]|nr:RNA polymerase sigma factor [Planctomycetota bacterium]